LDIILILNIEYILNPGSFASVNIINSIGKPGIPSCESLFSDGSEWRATIGHLFIYVFDHDFFTVVWIVEI